MTESTLTAAKTPGEVLVVKYSVDVFSKTRVC